MNSTTLLTFGETFQRQPSSIARVSIWIIPESTRYDQAHSEWVYFDSTFEAEEFEKRMCNPPELAVIDRSFHGPESERERLKAAQAVIRAKEQHA